MDNDSEEECPDWNGFWNHIPSPDDPHEFRECMEDWHDYEWRKEQKERGEQDFRHPLQWRLL